mmetsp:Transcript_105452/g.178159  ORF Transcript_105452/g.178159 Transcript_105452/m.178159 type:complete len:82 (+) Transcript_105452:697-942(+)
MPDTNALGDCLGGLDMGFGGSTHYWRDKQALVNLTFRMLGSHQVGSLHNTSPLPCTCTGEGGNDKGQTGLWCLENAVQGQT